MLRIRMGLDDLARVRMGTTGVAATIEAVYSTLALRRADSALSYGDWGRRLRPRLGADMAPLFELFTTPRQLPLFMIKRTDDPAVFADHLLALPTDVIRTGLLANRAPDTPFTRRLATGDRSARTSLASAVESYHNAFADTVPTMRSVIHADLMHRAMQLATDGLATLFNTLHPAMRWHSPYLEVSTEPDQEITLDGRPLQLTPSVFMRHGLGILIEPEIAFITYPARGSLRLSDVAGDPLADLLGRTRAAALRTLLTPHTTSDLAATLGISPASASQHATILRRARLIETHRTGQSVRHHLTPLGHTTLAADPLSTSPIPIHSPPS